MIINDTAKDNIRTFSSILSIIASSIGIYVFLKDTKKERDAKKNASVKV